MENETVVERETVAKTIDNTTIAKTVEHENITDEEGEEKDVTIIKKVRRDDEGKDTGNKTVIERETSTEVAPKKEDTPSEPSSNAIREKVTTRKSIKIIITIQEVDDVAKQDNNKDGKVLRASQERKILEQTVVVMGRT